jgi:fucose 4-O-acetylase-like acetyltransferase
VPIASYLNGLHYSLFPVFPWSAFLFAGALCGYFYLRAKDAGGGDPGSESIGRMMTKSSRYAVGMIALSFLIHPLAAMIYPSYNYWLGPSFYMLRLGLVLLLCVVMYLYERNKGVSPRSFVSLMGRESLLVYATHLMLVFGKFGYFTFTDRVNRQFGYGEAIITTLILAGMMYLLALGWTRVKSAPPHVKRITQGVVLAGFILVFFFGPR